MTPQRPLLAAALGWTGDVSVLIVALALAVAVLGLLPLMFRRRLTLREARELLQYRVDNMLARGPAAQFFALIVGASVVTILGSTAYFFGLFSVANQGVEGIRGEIDRGFFDTVWWSLQHVLDGGGFQSDYGAALPVALISLFLTVMGLVLFGVMVGFINSGMQTRLDSLRKGNSLVKESAHVLILGWSNKVFSILNLLDAYDSRLTVVILSEHDIGDMREALRLGVPRRVARRVILRTGSRTNLGELHRVAFDRAYSIIVLTEEWDQGSKEDADVSVIKTLMVLSSYRGWKGVRPKMVAEVIRADSLEAAQIAGERRIPIILSSEVISKIIVQSSRQPGLSSIYSEIFAFHGNEIYVRDFPQCAGRRFDSLSALFGNAVPIGLSSARQEGDRFVYLPHLNPPGDRIVAEGEWIILVAPSQNIAFDPSATSPPPSFAPRLQGPQILLERVLILGWNRNLYQVLREFDAYLRVGARVTVAGLYDEQTAGKLLLENIPEGFKNIGFAYRQANYVKRHVLNDLLSTEYDSIVVLADTSSGEEDVDARIIMTMLMLRDVQQREGTCAGARVVSEITSIEHRTLLEGGNVSDIVVSPDIVSMLLTQISQQQMLMTVYADLLDAGGNEVYLKPAERYVPLATPVTFRDVSGSALQAQEVAIGVLLAREGHTGNGARRLRINPHAGERLEFGEGDMVVVIGQDLFD